ncbi:hypothetical protein ACFFUO_00725 [Vibrio artabrorum]|uniref:Uncharacterized protein n=1 Tax=Vibrio artabrorum TaxID=446374 RepID=A0ABT8CHT0_9VIBR|nr:hypothetical protein [Vibrio artabrorum]MDN3700452.1 hypothetical protein [Vibrio artabrorum]
MIYISCAYLKLDVQQEGHGMQAWLYINPFEARIKALVQSESSSSDSNL